LLHAYLYITATPMPAAQAKA